ISYQWMESPDGMGNWTNVVGGIGANTPTYTTPILRDRHYYSLKTTCGPSGGINASNFVAVDGDGPLFITYGSSYSAGFENGWTNLCDFRDQPGTAWANTPSSGESSWRRVDDISSGGWQNPGGGTYSPSASTGSGSARFHSQGASAGQQGNLDLHLNMFGTSEPQELNFDYINIDGSDWLAVLVSTDGGDTFTPLGPGIGNAASWTGQMRVIPPPFTHGTVIRFQATSDHGS